MRNALILFLAYGLVLVSAHPAGEHVKTAEVREKGVAKTAENALKLDKVENNVINAIDSVKKYGDVIRKIGSELQKTKSDLAVISETLNSNTNNEEIQKVTLGAKAKVQNAEKLVKEAGEYLSKAGKGVKKAAFDIESYSARTQRIAYEANAALQEELDTVTESVKLAATFVKGARAKIQDARDAALSAGSSIADAIATISKSIRTGESYNVNATIDDTYSKVLGSLVDALGSMEEAGAKLTTAGRGVIESGFKLGKAVAKVALTTLEEQRQVLYSQITQDFDSNEPQDVTGSLKTFVHAGEEIVKAGRSISTQVFEFLNTIPGTFIKQLYEDRDVRRAKANKQ